MHQHQNNYGLNIIPTPRQLGTLGVTVWLGCHGKVQCCHGKASICIIVIIADGDHDDHVLQQLAVQGTGPVATPRAEIVMVLPTTTVGEE